MKKFTVWTEEKNGYHDILISSNVDGKNYKYTIVPEDILKNGESIHVLMAVADYLGFEPSHILNIDWDKLDNYTISNIINNKNKESQE